MIPVYTIRDSEIEDVLIIANGMRLCDIKEIYASSQLTPYQALSTGRAFSTICGTVCRNRVPMAMWGVVDSPLEEKTGSIWMLGTPDLEKDKKYFIRQSLVIIRDLQKRYTKLFNYVDCRSQQSIQWLKRCGAHFDQPAPYGALGLNFQYFYFDSREAA